MLYLFDNFLYFSTPFNQASKPIEFLDLLIVACPVNITNHATVFEQSNIYLVVWFAFPLVYAQFIKKPNMMFCRVIHNSEGLYRLEQTFEPKPYNHSSVNEHQSIQWFWGVCKSNH